MATSTGQFNLRYGPWICVSKSTEILKQQAREEANLTSSR